MFIARGLMRYKYTLLVPIIILIFICPLVVSKAVVNSAVGYEIPIYQIPISENTQRDIWKLCEENHLSYELVLAIYHTEGIDQIQIDANKSEIQKLVYLRDYWAKQGCPDEMVYELMLLSRQRGIEGCISYMKDNDSSNIDNYVQKVTEYKYYLEQRQ